MHLILRVMQATVDTSTRLTALGILAANLVADARSCGTFYGDRKVFLSTIPGVDVRDPEWRSLLDELRRTGLLTFARADLVAAMDPALVAASEWEMCGTTAHFLVVVP